MRPDRNDRLDVERIIAGATSAHRRLSVAARAWAELAPTAESGTAGIVRDRLGALVVDVYREEVAVDDPLGWVAAFERSNRILEEGWARDIAHLDRRHPYRRWRAVEVAHLELGRSVEGISYGLDDLPGDFVRRELRELEMLWAARRPIGLTALPPEAMGITPIERLGWLMGIIDVPGLAPSGLADITG